MDRCKHIFKLSQGEYVAPEKIESVYMESRFVSQVFVDGDTEQAYPVAIVVPEVETLVQHINSKAGSGTANGNSPKHSLPNGYVRPQNGEDVNASGEHAPPPVTTAAANNTTFVVHGTQMTVEQLCDYKPAIKAVLDDLNALGKVRGLKGFEQVHLPCFFLPLIAQKHRDRQRGRRISANGSLVGFAVVSSNF